MQFLCIFFTSVLMGWMKLEPFIQSEISQKEKHQQSILIHYMEFRKMVTMTLYVRQQKRHRCKEQTFGLWEKARVRWFERKHWNMYITISETNCQSRFDAWDRVLRAGALGWPWGMGCEGRWKGVFRMRKTCTPMADSCQCMAKNTTIL